MRLPPSLCEVRYPDRFLRDLARRVNFLLVLSDRVEEPGRFLRDLKRLLEEPPGDRAGAPAR